MTWPRYNADKNPIDNLGQPIGERRNTPMLVIASVPEAGLIPPSRSFCVLTIDSVWTQLGRDPDYVVTLDQVYARAAGAGTNAIVFSHHVAPGVNNRIPQVAMYAISSRPVPIAVAIAMSAYPTGVFVVGDLTDDDRTILSRLSDISPCNLLVTVGDEDQSPIRGWDHISPETFARWSAAE